MGELCDADENTLGMMASLFKSALEEDEVEYAIGTAIDMYELTGDEQIAEVARKLIDAVQEAAGTDAYGTYNR